MNTVAVADVAKKRSPKSKLTETPVPSPAEPENKERKPLALQMRANPGWKDWLEEAAKHDGRSLASFVERAALVYAKQIGFTKEPPER
jgi:hypothetical protein